MKRSPAPASDPMRFNTSLSAGSMNGVTAPLRAKTSQARPRSTIGINRAISIAPFSVAPLQRPSHQHPIDAVGRKAEQPHRQRHREHSLIGAARAQKADQIAEALLRHNQFGADQQD